jgi:hypothetical protein
MLSWISFFLLGGGQCHGEIYFPVQSHNNVKLNDNDSAWVEELADFEVINKCYVFKFKEGDLMLTYDVIDYSVTYVIKNNEIKDEYITKGN